MEYDEYDMRWVDIKEKNPPKNMPYFAKAGGYILLCTPMGDGILQITDCEQWQYTFINNETIQIRGRKIEYWCDPHKSTD